MATAPDAPEWAQEPDEEPVADVALAADVAEEWVQAAAPEWDAPWVPG